MFRGEPSLPPASSDVGVCVSAFGIATMPNPCCNGREDLQWECGAHCVLRSSTSRSKWCRIACIHWNFTHGLCVVQFSKTLHVLQTAEYMTWKTPTHVYEACNQHNSSCCKMETPGNFALTLPWLESKYLRDRTDQNYESTDVLLRTGRRTRPPLM